jgi:excisionase family DNA binding protein
MTQLLDEEPLLVSIEAAGRMLGIGRTRAYEMASAGTLPGVIRIGRSVKVSRKALVGWVDSRVGEGFLEVVPGR